MTIASEITKLQTNLANSYTAVDNKGGTLPASENFDNLADAIDSIPSGGGLKYGASPDDLLADVDSSNNPIMSQPTQDHVELPFADSLDYEYARRFMYGGMESLEFTNMTSCGASAFYHAFDGNTNIKSFKANKLQTMGVSGFRYAFQGATGFETAEFDSLTTIQLYGFQYSFINTKIKKIVFNGLETIAANSVFNEAFSGSDLNEFSAPKLKSINSGTQAFLLAFSNKFNVLHLQSLQNIGNGSGICYAAFKQFTNSPTSNVNLCLPELTLVYTSSNSTSYGQLSNASGLKKIYLPKLTQVTGSGNATMFAGDLYLTEIHFGKENQATIEAMAGYSNLWGRGAGKATVYFDLINTITVGGVNYIRDGFDYDYDNGYFAWKASNDNIVYTTDEYAPLVGDNVYTKSGDTYTVSGTISATA